MSRGVSVIIPVFRKEKKLVRALNSIVGQTYQGEKEVIIIWDNPKDYKNLINYVKRVEKTNDNVSFKILINPTKTNPAEARNRGLEESSYEYIFFLDSDDFFHEEKIERQLYLMKYKNVNFSYTDVIYVDVNGRYIRKVEAPNEVEIAKFWIPNKICTSSVCVKRKYVDMVGGFDESLEVCEDLDLWIRLSEVTKFGKVEGYYTFYTLPNNAIDRRILFDRYRIKVFRKNRYYKHLLRSYIIYLRGLIRCMVQNMDQIMNKRD